MEVNSGKYLPSPEAAKQISTTFADTVVNYCFNVNHTETKKNYFIIFQYTRKWSGTKLLTRYFVP